MKSLYKDLLKFQSELTPVTKDSKNPHFRNDYTSLLSVTEHLKEPLAKNGLIITQRVEWTAAGAILETKLIHADSGEFIQDITPILTNDNKPQSFGSALSYAKRYAKMTITGLTDTLEDDDAEKASGRPQNSIQTAIERKKALPEENKIKQVQAHDDFVVNKSENVMTKMTKEIRSVPVAEIVKLTTYIKSKGRTEAWLSATVKNLFGLVKLTDLTVEQIEKIKSHA